MEVFAGHLQPIHHPWISRFRRNDETGGLTGAAFSPTNEEKRDRIDIGAHRRG